MLSKLRAAAVAATVLASITVLTFTEAAANPVTWTLAGVSWTDGTTATGSFVYDADTDTFSGLNMTTSGGSIVPATNSWVFNVAGLPSSESNASGIVGFQAVDPASADETGASLVSLYSTGSSLLTNAGGTIPLDFLLIATCLDATCASYNNALPFSFDGSGAFATLQTSGVPEPLTLSIFGSGLAGAVAMRRRRKTGKTA